MKIDLNNYEAFFLDFAEGRLDNSSTLEMLAFLRNHPELKAELENFSNLRIEPIDEKFPGKDLLKKMNFGLVPVNHNNFDEFCIAHYEKILNESEKTKLFNYLEKYPERKSDFEKFGKVFLQADKTIVYEAKPFLKRKVGKQKIMTIIFRWTAAAAGILLAVSVFYRVFLSETEVSPKISSNVVKTKPAAQISESLNIATVATREKEIPEPAEIKKPAVQLTEVAETDSNESFLETDLKLLTPVYVTALDNPSILRPSFPEPNIEVPVFEKTGGEKGLLAIARQFVRRNLQEQEEAELPEKPEKRITLWDVADITLKGYNQISENDIRLHKETDENGKILTLAIETEGGKFGFGNKN